MADIYLYGGATNLNDIILRDPSHAAVTVGSVGGGGSSGKRWWEELQEEYAERYRLEHPELEPTKAKKAVKARKQVERLVEEARIEGLLGLYTASEAARLVVATRGAPTIEEALARAEQVKAYLRLLREQEDEDDILILAMALH
jgi:hypothetical protein